MKICKSLLILSLFVIVTISHADDAGSLSGLSGVSTGSSDAGSSSTNTTSSDSGSGGIIVPPITGVPNVSSVSTTTDSVDLVSDGADKNSVQNDDSTDDDSDSDDVDDGNTLSKGRGKRVALANINSGTDPFIANVYIRSGMRLKKFATGSLGSLKAYASPKNTPVPASYTIVPGDVIRVQSWGAVNANSSFKVNVDGNIFVPKLGEVYIAGVKAGQLNSYLTDKLGKLYRNFTLSTDVTKIHTIRIVVTGMTNRPGIRLVSSLSTLSSAVGAVGGPSSQGSLRDIELIRHGVVISHFDAYDLFIKGSIANDEQLQNDDIIRFKPLGDQVAIYDGVRRAAIYEIKNGETLQDVIHYAGGYSSDAKTDKVVIETINSNQAIQVDNYKTKDVLHLALSNGAIVHFFKTINKYENSVALVGNVVSPSRFGYVSGMTVKDVIPDKDVLLTQSYYNSASFNTVAKDNILTQAGVEKTTNGNAGGGLNMTTGLQSNTNQNNTKSIFGGGQNLFVAGPISIPEANINWNYAVIVRTDPENFSTHLIPFNLRKAIAGDPANNIALQSGDVINVLSAKDVRTASAGGSIYVFIDGEVLAPGVYELKNGQSLKDVVESAGGVSSKAYIFGMELTRESVKKQQAASLNQMLDQAQQSLMSQAADATSGVVNGDQARVQSLAIQQQLAFINKMRQIKPSGRIVLNLATGDATVNDIPDFKLDNGDSVYIPPRPDVINVVGQVYNPSTFMYASRYSIRNYIDMAGTENNLADKSAEYVLRADGTLYNKQQAGWFGTFDSRSLNPGDVVIVPQLFQIGSTMQNVMNITQILANTAQAIVLFTGTGTR